MQFRPALNELLNSTPKLSFNDAQLILLERYETLFSLHNHDAGNANPLSLAGSHYSEDVSIGSPLYEKMERFIEVDMYKYTGLSMTDFFDLPREYCLKLFETVARKQKKEDKLNENLTNQLKSLTGRS